MQLVHDGVGDGGLDQLFITGAGGQLAGEQSGAAVYPVVQQLQQVPGVGRLARAPGMSMPMLTECACPGCLTRAFVAGP